MTKPMSAELQAMLSRPRQPVDHKFVPIQRHVLDAIAAQMTKGRRKWRDRPDGTVDPDAITTSGCLKTIAGRP